MKTLNPTLMNTQLPLQYSSTAFHAEITAHVTPKVILSLTCKSQLPEVGENFSEKAETGRNIKIIFSTICVLYSPSLVTSRLRTENPKIKASVNLFWKF